MRARMLKMQLDICNAMNMNAADVLSLTQGKKMTSHTLGRLDCYETSFDRSTGCARSHRSLPPTVGGGGDGGGAGGGEGGGIGPCCGGHIGGEVGGGEGGGEGGGKGGGEGGGEGGGKGGGEGGGEGGGGEGGGEGGGGEGGGEGGGGEGGGEGGGGDGGGNGEASDPYTRTFCIPHASLLAASLRLVSRRTSAAPPE